MFTDNKYRRWYLALCERARGRVLSECGERHHVIPKSLGGTNATDNMVALTYREHFLAHWLLTKITKGDALIKMRYALSCMAWNPGHRIVAAWQYALARRICCNSPRSAETRAKMSAAWVGRVVSPETRAKQSAAMMGRIMSAETRAKLSVSGRNRSPETRAKLSAAGRNRSPETREKLRIAASNPSPEDRAKKSAAAKGRKATAETRAKISAAMIGHTRCVGRTLSAETKAKIGAASRNRSAESNAKIGLAQREIGAKRRAEKMVASGQQTLI